MAGCRDANASEQCTDFTWMILILLKFSWKTFQFHNLKAPPPPPPCYLVNWRSNPLSRKYQISQPTIESVSNLKNLTQIDVAIRQNILWIWKYFLTYAYAVLYNKWLPPRQDSTKSKCLMTAWLLLMVHNCSRWWGQKTL